MAEPICPQCHAALDADLIDSTGAAECPFCGKDLSEIDFGVSPNETDDADDNITASVSVSSVSADVALPVTSRIELIDTDPSRMVIYIPSGGNKARSIGIFALAWNGFLVVFTAVMIFGVGPGGDGLWIPLLLISLFWAVGLGMLYWWIRMRFTRLYLMLEQDRLVIQRILFGRKSIRETGLGPESGAGLVESYQQNDDPVYAVSVTGEDRTAKFGTALSFEEKQWLVHTINEFLGNRVSPADDLILRCDACGAEIDPKLLVTTEASIVCPSCGEKINAKQLAFGAVSEDDAEIPDLDPRDLPAESRIVIQENSPQRLALTLPAVPSGGPPRFIAAFLVLFSLVFSGGSLSALLVGLKDVHGPFSMIFVIVPGLFVLAGLIPLLMAVFLIRGRLSLDLSPETLTCRWHLGPLGYRKTIPTESITRVAVVSGFAGQRQLAGQPKLASSSGDYRVCMVSFGGQTVPITTFHDTAFARAMAGLLRFQLHRMGIELSDD